MKRSMLIYTLLAAIHLFLCVQVIWGQIPSTMSYQGVLINVDGTLMPDGNYSLNFRLYNAAEEGDILWEESQNVSVLNGIFNVILGSLNPLDIQFEHQYWLGVTVGADAELTPRIQLTSSAYSLNSRSVQDSSITGNKIMKHTVVRSINSLSDEVVLEAGENIQISPEQNRLIISATANGSVGGWIIAENDVYTAVSGNVGIGTTQPIEKLEINSGNLLVKGKGNFTAADDTATIFLGDSNHFIQSINHKGVRIGTFNAANGLFMEQNTGRIGIGTLKPTAELHVIGGMRVGAEEKNIVMYTQGIGEDISSTNTLHLNYMNNKDVSIGEGGTSNLYVSGKIGIGKTSPERQLHIGNGNLRVDRSGDAASVFLHRFSGDTSLKTFEIGVNASGEDNGMFFIGDSHTNVGGPPDKRFVIDTNGNIGIGLENPQGTLDVNGTIYQRGSQLHADYVFDNNYKLESIEKHAKFMWTNKHLKAIPKAKSDKMGCEIVEFGSHQRGIVEELEKAHIYIEQLHKRLKVLEEKIARIEDGNAVNR